MTLQEQMYDLYLLDRQVRGFKRRLDTATRRFNHQQTKLNQFKQQREELSSQLKHSQVKAADLENDARTLEQKIDHSRQAMNSVTSNKEYSALLQEVNTLKIDHAKLEDEALEQMGEVERIKQEIREIDDQITRQGEIVALAQQSVLEVKQDVGKQLDDLSTRHLDAEQKLPAEVLSMFSRLQDSHEGEAMAGVVEESRRHMEYSCGGCYISIPMERVNTLIIDKEQLVSCPNCGRILYLDQDLKESIASK